MFESQSVSILVAHELPLLREGLIALCERWPGAVVSHQCGNGLDVLRAVHEASPTVALLDSDLPPLPVLELIGVVRRDDLPTRVILLTTLANRHTAPDALRVGAHGVVLKSDSSRELLDAVRAVTEGRVYVAPSLQVDCFSYPVGGPADVLQKLSPREQQVFALLVEGVRAKEIAARLALSAKTVDTYRSSLMRKLDIHDLAGLVRFAIQRKLITI